MYVPTKAIETEELCSNGCGKKAKFIYKSGKVICSKNSSGCDIIKQKLIKNKGPSLGVEIVSKELCHYGCEQIAKFIYKSGKLCCSKSYNSCPKKRQNFSESDHTERTANSLKTRLRLGITKSSQIKATKTRIENGFYIKMADHLRKLWIEKPWNTNPKWRNFEDTDIVVQSTYEEKFLMEWKKSKGIEWVKENIKRGPHFYYEDPLTKKIRMYLSDFIINDIIYEVKGWYTWNKKEKDYDLELNNRAKLDSVIEQGYKVILVLEGKEIQYVSNIKIVDGKVPPG